MQGTLFDNSEPGRNAYGFPREIEPRDPRVTPEEAPRLSRQAREVLELFRAGAERSNAELAQISFRYGARLHDLRGAGCEFVITHRDPASGLVRYRMTHCPEGL